MNVSVASNRVVITPIKYEMSDIIDTSPIVSAFKVPQFGMVDIIGPDCVDVKKGDKVILQSGKMNAFQLPEGEKQIWMYETDILGIVESDDKET